MNFRTYIICTYNHDLGLYEILQQIDTYICCYRYENNNYRNMGTHRVNTRGDGIQIKINYNFLYLLPVLANLGKRITRKIILVLKQL